MPRQRLTIGGGQLGWVRDGWQGRIRAWQDRIRDPSLTVLLILYLAAIFIALPLAAEGLAIARPVADMLVLAVLAVVVLLSDRRGAVCAMLLALGIIAACLAFGRAWGPTTEIIVRRSGNIVAFSALIWVVGHAVYAPGRCACDRSAQAYSQSKRRIPALLVIRRDAGNTSLRQIAKEATPGRQKPLPLF
jgi:hypothetical protein